LYAGAAAWGKYCPWQAKTVAGVCGSLGTVLPLAGEDSSKLRFAAWEQYCPRPAKTVILQPGIICPDKQSALRFHVAVIEVHVACGHRTGVLQRPSSGGPWRPTSGVRY
jgi:hypothetical protein